MSGLKLHEEPVPEFDSTTQILLPSGEKVAAGRMSKRTLPVQTKHCSQVEPLTPTLSPQGRGRIPGQTGREQCLISDTPSSGATISSSPDTPHSDRLWSRRDMMNATTGLLLGGPILANGGSVLPAQTAPAFKLSSRPWMNIRGIYGGFPNGIIDRDLTPKEMGLNAIWVGSGGLDAAEIDRYHNMGVKVFAEFNTLHHAGYLTEHPDAAPIGPDGKPSPPADGWQGVSPFHAGYRQNRMEEFRRVLKTFEIDGIWLDYHHAHSNWERADPILPDTDFCDVALQQFSKHTGLALPSGVPEAAKQLTGEYRNTWTQFRCNVLTDWVREFREILNAERPNALLGTFHCPWSQDERDGAIRHKLAIDLPAQAQYLDIFSIMPYHARFGHVHDPAWISRQTRQLGELLNIHGKPGETKQIWPIVQLADWGETVTVDQIPYVLDHGSRPPATGVMAFHWSGLSRQWEKVDALSQAYLQMEDRS